MANNNISLIEELFNAQAHLGHKTNRVHPKAKQFIYRIENGVSIIDLTLTVNYLEEAKKYAEKLAQEGKTLVVVATKKIAAKEVEEECRKHNIHFITSKWPAGFLTNFETLLKNVKKLREMKAAKENGEWNKLVKHEQSELNKQLSKLERHYGGLINLDKLPDALFVIDVKKEKNAVKEANDMRIPTIAISDTNVSPDSVTYPIPANDDALPSIQYIVKEIISSYTKK